MASHYILHRSSICIQLIVLFPFPNIAATPKRKGILNSLNAPPSLLNTIPVRSFTNLIPNADTGSELASQRRQVSPRKSLAGKSVSKKPSFLRSGSESSPYQPMADEETKVFI